jgi:hypothetical protein
MAISQEIVAEQPSNAEWWRLLSACFSEHRSQNRKGDNGN